MMREEVGLEGEREDGRGARGRMGEGEKGLGEYVFVWLRTAQGRSDTRGEAKRKNLRND